MPGRGELYDYLGKAAKSAKDTVEEHFSESSDAMQASVVSGVFGAYVQNIVPTDVLESSEPDAYLEKASRLTKSLIETYFDDWSDLVHEAVSCGVFSAYKQNIVPSYLIEAEGY